MGVNVSARHERPTAGHDRVISSEGADSEAPLPESGVHRRSVRKATPAARFDDQLCPSLERVYDNSSHKGALMLLTYTLAGQAALAPSGDPAESSTLSFTATR
ncbi:hypothetical protein AOT83_23930 [Mycobacteroides sp. H001]|nr:hypothetical protein AOT86_05885 [Mycobacteroides sp. H072]KRQ37057.1 hypothetical protein AOT84_12430 [Mycobacteroides sp. H002]KRQ55682.1 hypothetical protein AOT85_01835 [Mycobacteroides sp. H054]KRQ66290.1 hypothetical protein AOT83_23930 [Mycobacteroides sp. H001]